MAMSASGVENICPSTTPTSWSPSIDGELTSIRGAPGTSAVISMLEIRIFLDGCVSTHSTTRAGIAPLVTGSGCQVMQAVELNSIGNSRRSSRLAFSLLGFMYRATRLGCRLQQRAPVHQQSPAFPYPSSVGFRNQASQDRHTDSHQGISYEAGTVRGRTGRLPVVLVVRLSHVPKDAWTNAVRSRSRSCFINQDGYWTECGTNEHACASGNLLLYVKVCPVSQILLGDHQTIFSFQI